MPKVRITVRPNGPLRVEDPDNLVELVDVEGNKYDLTGKTAFSLCRCGDSANRPFCDGTHKIDFEAPDMVKVPSSTETPVADTAVKTPTTP